MYKVMKKLLVGGIKRFYVTAPLIIFFYLYSNYAAKMFLNNSNPDILVRMGLSIVFTMTASLLIHGVDEQFGARWKHSPFVVVSANAVMGFLFTLYFLIKDFQQEHHVLLFAKWALLGVSMLAVFVLIPYRRRFGLGRHLARCIQNLLISGVFSGVLMLGLFFISFTLNELFDLRQMHLYINEEIYLFLFSFYLVFPMTFISLYPEQNFSKRNGEEENSEPGDGEDGIGGEELGFVLRILLFYILIPLLMVYTVVLYIYFLKLAFTAEFPNNVLANLVIWFLFVSHVVMFFVSGISSCRNEFEHWIIHKSHRYLPALILPAGMMFVSIFLRIDAYGFTEMRYYLLLFGIFNTVGLMFLYFFRWRAQVGVVLLAFFLLHGSLYGYFSVDRVTYRSQLAVLERKLAEQGYDFNRLLAEGVTDELELNPKDSSDLLSHVQKVQETSPKLRDSAESRLLAELEELLIGERYLVYAGNEKAGSFPEETVSAYHYYHVFEPEEGTYFFRLSLFDEQIFDEELIFVADVDGIRVFDNEEYISASGSAGKEIFFFSLADHVLKQNAEQSEYSFEFSYKGRIYSGCLMLVEIMYQKDELEKEYKDFYKNYDFNVLLRRR